MREIEGIKLFTVTETADTLGITPQTVRAYIKQGKLKGQRIGRPILITENSIKKFLNGGAEPQQTENN
ncbi:MAG: helix-turn-helix domain-containing protein [Candidatus Dojkabacteria bacterium]